MRPDVTNRGVFFRRRMTLALVDFSRGRQTSTKGAHLSRLQRFVQEAFFRRERGGIGCRLVIGNFHPQPSTLNPQPATRNPQPLNPT
jgi:hypothetical protein